MGLGTHLSHSLLLIGLVLVFSTSAAAQSVLYEFREFPEDPPIATLEFASPPASAETAWSTTNPADLLSLTADDTRFELGAGNVADPIRGYSSFSVSSVAGVALDGGGIMDDAPSLIELSFSAASRGDIFESFGNAAFVSGDWTLATTTITLTPVDTVVISTRSLGSQTPECVS